MSFCYYQVFCGFTCYEKQFETQLFELLNEYNQASKICITAVVNYGISMCPGENSYKNQKMAVIIVSENPIISPDGLSFHIKGLIDKLATLHKQKVVICLPLSFFSDVIMGTS